MATLDDVVTVQKNGVIAINNLNQTLKTYNEGQTTSTTVTDATVICTGAGRVISVIVVTAGSGSGYLYNLSSTSSPTLTNALMSIPNTTGVYPVNAKFNTGLTVVPGSGQYVNVTYSLD